jgi:hypothetical protein
MRNACCHSSGLKPSAKSNPKVSCTRRRAGEVLEVDVGGFLSAYFTAETVESGDGVFERVADQMVAQLFVNRLGKGELLVGEFEILGEDLKRVVYPTVGAPSKNT